MNEFCVVSLNKRMKHACVFSYYGTNRSSYEVCDNIKCIYQNYRVK